LRLKELFRAVGDPVDSTRIIRELRDQVVPSLLFLELLNTDKGLRLG